MSTNDYIDVAYRKSLMAINNYIVRNEVKKTYIAKLYKCSRTTLNDYLKGNVEMPYRFILFMKHLMQSDPCK